MVTMTKKKKKDLKPLHIQRQEDTPGTKAPVSTVVGMPGSSGRSLLPHPYFSPSFDNRKQHRTREINYPRSD